MARLTDKLLRILLTAAFGVVKKRARRRPGVHAIALTPERRIILIRLRYARGWRLPGGGVAHGETLEDAARRELREEIGMTGHGSVRQGAAEPEPVLIVEDVQYRPPPWSWEVEAIIETPIDALPSDVAPIARRWINVVLPKL